MTFFKKIDFILCGNHFRLTDSSESCRSGHPFPTGVRVSPSCRSYGHAKNLTSVRGCELSPDLPGLPPPVCAPKFPGCAGPHVSFSRHIPSGPGLSPSLLFHDRGRVEGGCSGMVWTVPQSTNRCVFSWSDRGVSSGQDHTEAMRPSQHARSGRRRHPRGWALVVARVRKGPPGF